MRFRNSLCGCVYGVVLYIRVVSFVLFVHLFYNFMHVHDKNSMFMWVCVWCVCVGVCKCVCIFRVGKECAYECVSVFVGTHARVCA